MAFVPLPRLTSMTGWPASRAVGGPYAPGRKDSRSGAILGIQEYRQLPARWLAVGLEGRGVPGNRQFGLPCQ